MHFTQKIATAELQPCLSNTRDHLFVKAHDSDPEKNTSLFRPSRWETFSVQGASSAVKSTE